jgi:hypothetical protein
MSDDDGGKSLVADRLRMFNSRGGVALPGMALSEMALKKEAAELEALKKQKQATEEMIAAMEARRKEHIQSIKSKEAEHTQVVAETKLAQRESHRKAQLLLRTLEAQSEEHEAEKEQNMATHAEMLARMEAEHGDASAAATTQALEMATHVQALEEALVNMQASQSTRAKAAEQELLAAVEKATAELNVKHAAAMAKVEAQLAHADDEANAAAIRVVELENFIESSASKIKRSEMDAQHQLGGLVDGPSDADGEVIASVYDSDYDSDEELEKEELENEGLENEKLEPKGQFGSPRLLSGIHLMPGRCSRQSSVGSMTSVASDMTDMTDEEEYGRNVWEEADTKEGAAEGLAPLPPGVTGVAGGVDLVVVRSRAHSVGWENSSENSGLSRVDFQRQRMQQQEKLQQAQQQREQQQRQIAAEAEALGFREEVRKLKVDLADAEEANEGERLALGQALVAAGSKHAAAITAMKQQHEQETRLAEEGGGGGEGAQAREKTQAQELGEALDALDEARGQATEAEGRRLEEEAERTTERLQLTSRLTALEDALLTASAANQRQRSTSSTSSAQLLDPLPTSASAPAPASASASPVSPPSAAAAKARPKTPPSSIFTALGLSCCEHDNDPGGMRVGVKPLSPPQISSPVRGRAGM